LNKVVQLFYGVAQIHKSTTTSEAMSTNSGSLAFSGLIAFLQRPKPDNFTVKARRK